VTESRNTQNKFMVFSTQFKNH